MNVFVEYESVKGFPYLSDREKISPSNRSC